MMTSSPGSDADGQQRQVQRRGAVGNRAGVRRADVGGELVLEGRDLGPLRDPAGPERAAAASASSSPMQRLGDRDHWAISTSATRRSNPSSSGTLASKPMQTAGLVRCRPGAAAPG